MTQSIGVEQSEQAKAAFLREVEARGVLPRSVSSEDAAVAVVAALAQRLTTGEVHRFLRALPDALRPLFTSAAEHRSGLPPARFDRAELLDAIAADLAVTPAQAEWIARVVFRALRAHMEEREADNVSQQLPAELKALWSDRLQHGPPPELGADDVIRAIDETVTLPEATTATDAFSAVMCALSERLSGGETRKVFLAIPESLRIHLQACMLHRGEAPSIFGREELVARVARHLGTTDAEAERIARAVIAAVKGAIPEKDVDDVASQLPPDLRALWTGAR